ncbi:MAG: hypothetical protein KBT67_02285 [bacterium]|nr:hypothetical protein [Candidatus Limimorpha caballi]MCQ2315193.1 hypothetical protein [Bacteroidales bacterium]
MNTEPNEIPLNIGRMIDDYISSNEMSKESAAGKLNMDVAELQKILENPSMGTEMLKRISVALGHNFMADIAELVDKELADC